MKMKIYLAAPFADRDKMPDIASKVESLNYEITHSWWEVEVAEEYSIDTLTQQAIWDLNGVLDADIMLLLNSSKSEGKAVEQGLAISKGIPIIAVGKRGEHSKNVFHYLPHYFWVNTLEAALEGLDKLTTLAKETHENYGSQGPEESTTPEPSGETS